MSHDYGPLRTYEITWKSGHVETVQGHQVTFDSWRSGIGLPGIDVDVRTEPRFAIHGSFDDQWRLMLSAPEAELHTLRDITDREIIPGAPA